MLIQSAGMIRQEDIISLADAYDGTLQASNLVELFGMHNSMWPGTVHKICAHLRCRRSPRELRPLLSSPAPKFGLDSTDHDLSVTSVNWRCFRERWAINSIAAARCLGGIWNYRCWVQQCAWVTWNVYESPCHIFPRPLPAIEPSPTHHTRSSDQHKKWLIKKSGVSASKNHWEWVVKSKCNLTAMKSSSGCGRW